MKNTIDLRQKLLGLWEKFEKGDMDSQEAKTHIGFAKTTIDSMKLEIAAASVMGSNIIEPIKLFDGNTTSKRKVIA